MLLSDFKKEQKVAYKTLYNSFLNGHKSHAYLISGEKDSYVKDVAILMAKSFVCDDDVLCCEKCRNCRRIDDNSYCDYVLINENEGNILTDDIENLRNEFSMTALEPKGIKIYIIHLIEKANASAVNKLLKFLEEPNDNVYAILTTKNLSQVLPTIVSRCQLIRIISPTKEKLFNKLTYDAINNDDANILSMFCSSYEEAKKLYDNEYKNIKEDATNALKLLLNNKDDLPFFIIKEIENKYSDKKDIKLFLDILCLYIKDLLLNNKEGLCPSYIKINDNINLENILTNLLISKGKLSYNINTNLLLDQLVYDIVYKEDK